MPHVVLRKPNYLDEMCEYWKVIDGKKTWRSVDRKRIYQWDSLHGEIEVYNGRGYHLGSADALSGTTIKDAVNGRRISDV